MLIEHLAVQTVLVEFDQIFSYLPPLQRYSVSVTRDDPGQTLRMFRPTQTLEAVPSQEDGSVVSQRAE